MSRIFVYVKSLQEWILKVDYRLDPVNLKTVNSNFIINLKFIFRYTHDLMTDQRIQQ